MPNIVIKLGPNWKGIHQVKSLIVFGDSYSAVGYHKGAQRPTPQNPVGVPLPGYSYNEPDGLNWVGHLLKSYCGGRDDILVYDYAVGGHRVDGVWKQIQHEFWPSIGSQPSWAPWTADTSLFVTWVGINDCAFIGNAAGVQKAMEKLFAAQEELYVTGARNFLFVDLPPIDRSPAVPRGSGSKTKNTIHNWNAALVAGVESFLASHLDVTAMVWSSWDTFTRILDDPVSFGFPASDARQEFGSIWYDKLHPTSAVHRIIARDISEFIHSQHADISPID
ncbi:carbohydrate esterase family 16 protein [Auriscalpium vulgare]|uniref:Carbohydrate esterase family 16 protein n=1 Tax=Auriscalpium vulgare TaxID=40419 RepID=A0ACB8SE75_9AGAM|nr:carbohydrate esterase family 16 protein [Auriscalpium vulgare]